MLAALRPSAVDVPKHTRYMHEALQWVVVLFLEGRLRAAVAGMSRACAQARNVAAVALDDVDEVVHVRVLAEQHLRVVDLVLLQPRQAGPASELTQSCTCSPSRRITTMLGSLYS